MSSNKIKGLVGVYVLEEHLELSKKILESSEVHDHDSFEFYSYTEVSPDWFNNFMEVPLGFICSVYSSWYSEEIFEDIKEEGIPAILLNPPEEEEKLITTVLLEASVCKQTGMYEMEQQSISIDPVPNFLSYSPTASAILRGEKTPDLLSYVSAWANSIKIPSFKGQAERYHHNQAIKLIKG